MKKYVWQRKVWPRYWVLKRLASLEGIYEIIVKKMGIKL